ncbi:MAG: hypothetical protein RJA70_4252 [Pseudomonadota bacterium]|jgi:hypothetical protein
MFAGPGWSIELAAGWEAEEEDDCISIFHPDGVGTLQLSTAHKEEEHVTADELDDLAQDCAPPGVKLQPLKVEGWKGVGGSFVDDEDAWRVWCLRSGSYALFITYDCPAADSGTEDSDVDAMLKTLGVSDGLGRTLN